jgi:UDP-N-acetylmuramate--alanine ligase
VANIPAIDETLKTARRVHFIGAGGSGMCPLEEILLSWGYDVTGSDNNESETLERVREAGVKVAALGQRAENINGADMIVYTAAVLQDNPELVAARESGIPMYERSELLGAVTRRYKNCICVSGTHGKTTTTAMLTQILLTAKLSPSAVIGGKLPATNSNGMVGKSENMVCEACEFQDHYLALDPDAVVILNIDEDHLEYFKNLKNIIASFKKFALMAKKYVLYNGDDDNTRECLSQVAKDKTYNPHVKLLSFGRGEQNTFRAANVRAKNALYSYDLIYNGDLLTRIQLSVPGEHNVLNSLAAIAAAMLSDASVFDCEKGAAAFKGAGRRFEIIGEFAGVTLADDYAHHPKELEVTLRAAKQMNYKNVWAVFQPFTFSRTAILLDDFAKALPIADKVVMTKIMGSREINTYGISTQDLADRIPGSVWFEEFPETAAFVAANAAPGDLVITLGCGDVYKCGKIIKALLEKKSEVAG